MRTYSILGIRVTDDTFAGAIARMKTLANARGSRSLFFVNAHTLNVAATDAGYRDVLSRASIVYGDGTGVRWAALLRGLRLRANLNGTDVVPALLDRCEGRRCFIVGSTPERTARIARTFVSHFPDVRLVGITHGYLDAQKSRWVAEAVNETGADIVLVGMGNPLQEVWIDRYGSRMPNALLIGVGGLLEYWSGALDRAPPWMRRAGLEWLHIMVRQPWKLPRYLIGGPLYLLRALRHLPLDSRRDVTGGAP